MTVAVIHVILTCVWYLRFSPATGYIVRTSRPREYRRGLGGLRRVDRREFEFPILGGELPDEVQETDLRPVRSQLEGPVQSFQPTRKAEKGFSQRQLVDALGNRERLFDDEAGIVPRQCIETELELLACVTLLECGAKLLQV